MKSNRIVREETCFNCNRSIAVLEYTPYSADEYIRITVVNGIVVNRVAVCHPCFNKMRPEFTAQGWTYTVGGAQ